MIVLLVVCFGCGWLLVPRTLVAGPRLLRLACMLAVGMAFVSCVTATICCQRPMFLTLVPLVQVAAAVLARRRIRDVCSDEEPWSMKDKALVLGVVVAGTLLFQAPYDVRLPGGAVREPNPDLGFYAQLVMALPHAGAANSWAALLGSDAVAASGVRDHWYHWGAMYLAVAVRTVLPMPAVDALLRVVCPLLSVLLILSAGAAAGGVCRRRSIVVQVALGLVGLLCVQWLRTPELMMWLKRITAGDYSPHMRYPMATALAYKYEGVLGLTAMALWVHGRWRQAAMVLFFAALAAPHIVAALGVGAAPLVVVGLVARRRALWMPGLVILAILLGAWVALGLMGGAFPRARGASLLKVDMATLGLVSSGFARDLMITMVFSASTLPGLLHLIRLREPEDEPLRLLGWLALLAGVGACAALQLMPNNPDRFHVMTLAQALIVMPVSLWGLARLVAVKAGALRWLALGLLAGSVTMGVDTIFSYRRVDTVAPWTERDLDALRAQLKGQPFGYMTMEDRGWWISKHGLLGALIGSRCARIIPIPGEQAHTSFYGESAPFRFLPPTPKESTPSWSDRFARALGIRHLIETEDDPLPPPLKTQCRKLVEAGGVTVYELPEKVVIGGPKP